MRLGRQSTGKLIVVVAVLGATIFGLFLGYLAYTNDSFPTATRPFASYATVSSAVFNGTEVSYNITWDSAKYSPQFAQMTSPNSDEANSPVCGLDLNGSATPGQSFVMPFATTSAATGLSLVTLSVDVQSNTNKTSFTIQYTLNNMTAVPGNLMPSTYSCSEPAGADL